MIDHVRSCLTLRMATLALSIVMLAMLAHYFFTGAGGPRLLAVRLVPLALIIQLLSHYQNSLLYPSLSVELNRAALLLYGAVCFYVLGYLNFEYDNIAIWRQGSYSRHDVIVGTLIFLVVMEISRLFHPILFWVNMALIGYTLWGYLSPIDFFWHPGTSLRRVVTSSTVEFTTGIFGLYSQLALTLIAAFLLLAAAAHGFGAQSAVIQVMRRLAGRSRHTVPQTAVLASVAVGMVSGSGSANTAVTGSFTIPLMQRYGIPGVFAGAVETAASMGGLIMPPLMAVAGFLMAEFLNVPYWDVVLRGFAVATVYFTSLVLAVYLLSVRLLPDKAVAVPAVPPYEQAKTATFFAAIGLLILLMGWLNYGALRAALLTAGALFLALLGLYLVFKLGLRDPALARESVLRNIRTTIETHAELTAYLTVLLATLGIMIGLITVTGFINRMGAMLLHLGDWHIIATILMAWVFGWLAGTGLPPTATYIIVAIIIVPPLRTLGIDPWVAHFFAFLMAVWGELSPPTSLTAAVASRIAGASFMGTMFVALKICLPIIFMSFAIFIRTDMVTTPGWSQIFDTALVTVGTCGITFATFGRFLEARVGDTALRAALTVGAFAVIFHPDRAWALAAAAAVAPAVVYGILRHRVVAPPKEAADGRLTVATRP